MTFTYKLDPYSVITLVQMNLLRQGFRKSVIVISYRLTGRQTELQTDTTKMLYRCHYTACSVQLPAHWCLKWSRSRPLANENANQLLICILIRKRATVTPAAIAAVAYRCGYSGYDYRTVLSYRIKTVGEAVETTYYATKTHKLLHGCTMSVCRCSNRSTNRVGLTYHATLIQCIVEIPGCFSVCL